jgi:hypothetical protein
MLDALDCASDFSSALIDSFAVLLDYDARDFFEVFLHKILQSEQVARACKWRRLPPVFVGLLRVLNSFLYIFSS